MVSKEQNMLTDSNIKRISRFLENNVVTADNSETTALECGDGRLPAEITRGKIRIFGGDYGAVAAVKLALDKKGLNYSVENVYERYKEAIARHTLLHDGLLHTHTHCRHIKTISDAFGWGGELYGLFLEEDPEKRSEIPLESPHEELDILFILGTEKSVNSKDAKTGESHFVVDIDRIKRFFNLLPEKLALLQLTGQDIWDAYEEQMGKTKEAIAADKKIYNVDLKGELKISPLA